MNGDNKKVALVTGGGSGIGRATSIAFARRGARVMVADLQEDAGQQTVAEISAIGGEASFVRTDVTKRAEVAAMVGACVTKFGYLDWALNAAGAPGKQASLIDWSEADFDLTYNVNVKGLWLCMAEEIRHMKLRNYGAIVNIASVGGLRGSHSFSGYGASKAGVVNLTMSGAVEFAGCGIRVNAICPGAINTPMLAPTLDFPGHADRIAKNTPLGRIGTPEEIANCVVFLCSDEASYATGVIMPVDGGITAG